MTEFKKPNNCKDGELQPYNPENGQYEENEKSKDEPVDAISVSNFFARRLGGLKQEFPLKFPNNNYSIEYLHYYFNNEIDWNDIVVTIEKMKFLIDIYDKKQRYLIFRNLLGYNENNLDDLQKQIKENAKNFEAFVNKKADKYGFRVKIYMPIKFANLDKVLIVKTCWLVNDLEKPRFLSAWYDNDYKEDLKDDKI